MGEPRARSKFGEIDLDLGVEETPTRRPPAAESFGELRLELPEDIAGPPVSAARPNPHTTPTMRPYAPEISPIVPTHSGEHARSTVRRDLGPSPDELAALAAPHRVPRVVMGPRDIEQLPIDHRAGFLLGFIDGMHTMEEILDVCAMPAAEALDLVRTLLELHVIEFDPA